MKKYIHLLAVVAASLLMTAGALTGPLWFDESYALCLLQQDLPTLLQSMAADVHPALYSLVSKAALEFIGLSPRVSPEGCILFLRLFSVLPMCLILVLSFTHIRRWFGENCGLLFALLVGFSASSYAYGTQLRMYSWAALFVLCTLLCACRCLRPDAPLKAWCALAACGLLSAYTHYYALAAIAFLQLFFLALIWKSGPAQRKRFILCALAQLLLYLPGLVWFARQASGVCQGYWITADYPVLIAELIGFFFQGPTPAPVPFTVLCFILGACVVGLILLFLRRLRRAMPAPHKSAALLCLFPLAAVPATGLLLSLARPVLISRYLFPMAGLYWLLVALILCSLKKRAAAALLCLAFCLAGLWGDLLRFRSMAAPENQTWKTAVTAQRTPQDAFFFSDLQVGCQPAAFFPDAQLFFYNQFGWTDKNGLRGFSRLIPLAETTDLAARLERGQRVWILDSIHTHLSSLDLGGVQCLLPPKIYYHPYSGEWIRLSLWKKP